ncbi:MAG: RluA family pseudouridine synthase [Gammaproteobacteria bacterium]
MCIDTVQTGRRIDNFLLGHFSGVPRSRVYQMIRKGEVRVNSGRVAPAYRLQAGDRVRLPPLTITRREDAALVPDAFGHDWKHWILHEDDGLLVLNKPSGLAVHGGTALSFGVIDILQQRHPAGRGLQLVHRLDRATSGCLLVAKDLQTLRHLHALLRAGQVQKQYLVLLRGHLPSAEARVEFPLDSSARRAGERHVAVSAAGKHATTRFKAIRTIGKATLALASIATGRTHQIRVHAAHSGYPVAGDDKYGDRQFNRELRRQGLRRLFLHASRIQIDRSGGGLSVDAPLPADLGRLLDNYAKAC